MYVNDFTLRLVGEYVCVDGVLQLCARRSVDYTTFELQCGVWSGMRKLFLAAWATLLFIALLVFFNRKSVQVVRHL